MTEKSQVYGINPVLEALKGEPARIDKVLVDRDSKNSRLYEISKECRKQGIICQRVPRIKIQKMAPAGKAQGVVAFMAVKAYTDFEEILKNMSSLTGPHTILVADGIEDPQNLGAMIRSAYCAGAVCLIMEGKSGAGLSPAVSRASAGAVAHLPVCQPKNVAGKLETLKEHGFRILGLDLSPKSGSLYKQDLTRSTVFILGSEKSGIRPHLKRVCDALVSIPMTGDFNSLNVSVTLGICLFEAVRQRAFK
jgi:23S rRNA (guanosine2251-2'-O)-methyltransferase